VPVVIAAVALAGWGAVALRDHLRVARLAAVTSRCDRNALTFTNAADAPVDVELAYVMVGPDLEPLTQGPVAPTDLGRRPAFADLRIFALAPHETRTATVRAPGCDKNELVIASLLAPDRCARLHFTLSLVNRQGEVLVRDERACELSAPR
jgi:hypothetical protein